MRQCSLTLPPLLFVEVTHTQGSSEGQPSRDIIMRVLFDGSLNPFPKSGIERYFDADLELTANARMATSSRTSLGDWVPRVKATSTHNISTKKTFWISECFGLGNTKI